MNYYNQIKEELINNEIYKKVKDYSKNRSDLNTYYNVGKLLIEAQGGEERAKYGDNLIKEYSFKLSLELGYKFNSRILWRARKFYLLFSNEKMSTLSTQLSCSHYVELMNLDSINKINYYIKISSEQNLSVRELRYEIRNKEYERLPLDTKNKLKAQNKIEITNTNCDEISGVEAPLIIYNGQDITYSKGIVMPKLRKQLLDHLREIRNNVAINIDDKIKDSTQKQKESLESKPITKILKK